MPTPDPTCRPELVGEGVRAALNALSAAAPDRVDEVLVVADWIRRYADRIDNLRLPTSKARHDELVLNCGKDGFTPLAALYAPASPS